MVALIGSLGALVSFVDPVRRQPHRILVDTDVDTDDVFALFYILKQHPKLFHLQVPLSLFDQMYTYQHQSAVSIYTCCLSRAAPFFSLNINHRSA